MPEFWDLYDKNREALGRTHLRGRDLAAGDYHLAVNVWIVNPEGKMLLTRRHPKKTQPLLWECTMGSVLAGEDSKNAALREVREEIGVDLRGREGSLIHRLTGQDTHYDVWLYRLDVALEDLALQEDEVCGARYAGLKDFTLGFERGEVLPLLAYVFGLAEARVLPVS